MRIALDNFVNHNHSGMFLLDAPTGFGKTSVVLSILKDFIRMGSASNIKRIFFVTNLKKNLPFHLLCSQLTEEEKQQCIWIKAYDEAVVENWSLITIPQTELKNSQEYKQLNNDIRVLEDLLREKEELKKAGKTTLMKQKSIQSFRNKIANITEPAFRKVIKNKYFNYKSPIEKKRFIQDNEWFRKLYPICEIEEKKVVFMTTKKFFSPINVFYRMPFFIYNDEILNDSVVYIDEFDASKKDVLDQIISNCININIDIISLFTNIYYVLKGQKFPQSLLQTKDAIADKGDEEKGRFYSSADILRINEEKFTQCYQKYNFELLLKSREFNSKKAFLFDDGHYITVYNDRNRKHLIVKSDLEENIIALTAQSKKTHEDNKLRDMLNEVYRCIEFFARGVKYLSMNYFIYVNSTRRGGEHRFSQEEALMTILSAFYLSEDNRSYITDILTDGRFDMPFDETLNRKGFKFTEVEDSDYHNLQTIAHQYEFFTTPENLIIFIAKKARLVGISATASIETVIGNYDLNYIKSVLGQRYVIMAEEDKIRIEQAFKQQQKIYDQVEISVQVIDDFNCFSDKEKAEELYKKIFQSDTLQEYLDILQEDRREGYYELIIAKLAYLYAFIGTHPINSFLCFMNRIPKINDDKLELTRILSIFDAVATVNGFEKYRAYIVNSENFDEEMGRVYSDLSQGKKCLVISSYQTVGAGKNIQYKIPDTIAKEDIIIQDKTRYEKDFDGVFLLMPTNLVQRLYRDAENIYVDLAKYLFQQQILHQNNKLNDIEYRLNVLNGFRRSFFEERVFDPGFIKNDDLCYHTAQLVIQAVGRICRCSNKNKHIWIFTDKQIVERLKSIKDSFDRKLFNREFLELVNMDLKFNSKLVVADYARQNNNVYWTIKKLSDTVRSSKQKVAEWQRLRDYVLRYPTGDNIIDKYAEYYFHFDEKQYGYAYKYGKNWMIDELSFDLRDAKSQVSQQDSYLSVLLSIPCIEKLFRENSYVNRWNKGNYIMTPALYLAVYKGALGEVVGKELLSEYANIQLQEIQDYSYYEYFDFQLGKVYFDFKHWKTSIADRDQQIKKIKYKLKRTRGERAIIINIVKRGEHNAYRNIEGDIIEIPYLIDDSNDISEEMINHIKQFCF